MADLTLKETELAFIILTTIYIVIFTPLSIYFAYQLWTLNQQNITFVTKRHPKVVIFMVILFNIYAIIIRPIAEYLNLYSSQTIMVLVLQLVIQYIVGLFCVRFWLLFYDYTHELKSLSIKWKSHISRDQIPWTHKYQWLGNAKLVTSIPLTLTTIIVIIIIVCAVSIGPDTIPYTICLLGIYVVFIVIIACKIRKCRDEFYILKEFKVLSMVFLCYIVFYLGVMWPFFPEDSNKKLVVWNIYLCSSCYVGSFIATFLVIQQYKKQLKTEAILIQIRRNSSQSNLSLEEVLVTKDGFDLFANHLVKEFSTENLFFVFEMVQVKKQAVHNKLVNEDDIGYIIPINDGLLDKYKREDINVSNLEALEKNMHRILEEYIFEEGKTCINVSADVRYNAIEKFNKLNAKHQKSKAIKVECNDINQFGEIQMDLIRVSAEFKTRMDEEMEIIINFVTVFDDAMKEIVELMRGDSLYRFYNSEEYRLLSVNNK